MLQAANRHKSQISASLRPSGRENVPRGSDLGLFALEPRIVFDAAAVATADATADQTAQAQAKEAVTGDAVDAQASAEQSSYEFGSAYGFFGDGAGVVEHADAPQEIAFIDGSVEGVSDLVASIPASVQIVMLDPSRDGVEQIASVLQDRSGISAIHILSHGSEGSLLIGSSTLDAKTMQGEYLDELTTIGQALTSDGDILIYGCDFTAGDSGLQAAMILGGITGADVASSIDATGSADLGGDWQLETKLGSVEAASIDAAGWSGLLNATANTGTWNVSTTGADAEASTVANGVTVSIDFDAQSANSSFTVTRPDNQTFNNIAAFTPSVGGTASLGVNYVWDTAPELASAEASGDGGTGVITIRFSEAVKDPIIHIDQLGGNALTVQNGARFVLLTPGVTMTRVSGTPHFTISGSQIYNNQIDVATGVGYTTESSMTANLGSAAGSVRINGTVTQVSFTIGYATGSNEGLGSDKFELGLTYDTPPVIDLNTTNNTPVVIATDNLDSNTPNAGTGWNGDWQVSGGAGGVLFTGGQIRVQDPDLLGSVQRSVNLSGYINPTVTFNYGVTGLGTDDFFAIEYSRDGGATWNVIVDSYSDGNNGNGGSISNFSLGKVGSADTVFRARFEAGAGTTSDNFRIDAVTINGLADTSRNFTANYLSGAAPVTIDSGVLITDATDTLIQSATIQIVNAKIGDILSVASALPSGIVATSFDPASNAIKLTGSASLAAYQTALAAIQFSSTSGLEGSRTISVLVNDGFRSSDPAYAYINLTADSDGDSIANSSRCR